MKKVFLLPTALAAILLMSFAPDTWVRYMSKEGHFSMNFPCKPSENKKTDTTADGKKISTYYVNCSPSDTEVYLASWVDMTSTYPKDKTLSQVLEESKDMNTSAMQATEVTTHKTVLTGAEPFIEFTFKTREYLGEYRIYVINKHEYSVIALGSLATGMTPKMDKFITSFKHHL